jgi:hypothetical protein
MGVANSETSCGRRRALKLFGAAAAFSGLAGMFGAAPADAKTSQATAAYRNAPSGRQRCANCSWFEPPSGCSVVRGPVNARGWCNLWG